MKRRARKFKRLKIISTSHKRRRPYNLIQKIKMMM